MMNSVIVEVPDTFEGVWVRQSTDVFLVDCGDGKLQPVDRLVYRGGKTVEKGNPVAGSYRLMLRCGHNSPIENLNECKGLSAYFDWAAANTTTST